MTKPKVLVVEDDADVRHGYQVLLRGHGIATCFAVDSVSAISAALRERPDVIVLDLGLPAGDGFIVMQRLRTNSNLSQIPIIVVSGRDRQGNEDRALEAGAIAYVQKPWDDEELLTLIREMSDD